MTAAFIPFAPARVPQAPSSPPQFAPTVATPTSAAPSPTALAPLSADRETQSPPPAGTCLPAVNLQRDGDRITRIQVKCSCGETIELDCEY